MNKTKGFEKPNTCSKTSYVYGGDGMPLTTRSLLFLGTGYFTWFEANQNAAKILGGILHYYFPAFKRLHCIYAYEPVFLIGQV